MRDKLNQFIANTNGQFIEVSSQSAAFQCMDLVYCFIFSLGFPKSTIQNQYAYQVYKNPKEITYEYFDLIPNTNDFVPQDGDIGVFDKTSTNVAGHIVICLGGGTTSRFKRFEQNSPIGTNAHVSEGSYNNFLGVLRPKIKDEETEPNWFTTLLLESNLSLDREGEFRSFWDKAKKYDDEVGSLRSQLVTSNEELSKKSTELAHEMSEVDRLKAKVDEIQDNLNKKGSELSEATFEKSKAEAEVEKLTSEIDILQERITQLEGQTPLKSYAWTTRFISLFGIFK